MAQEFGVRFSRAYGTGSMAVSPAAEAAGYYQRSLRERAWEDLVGGAGEKQQVPRLRSE